MIDDPNFVVAFVWTALAVLSGALAGGMAAYHIGKWAGVREYHEAREAKSAETRAKKKAARNGPIVTDEPNPTDWGVTTQRVNVTFTDRTHAVPRGVDTGEGDE